MDEVITRVEATLAAASARFEVRKEMTADPVTAPVQDGHRHGPFKRLAGVAVKAAWDHIVPEQARTRLRTASSGIAMGIIEPSTRQFQHHRLRQDSGMLAMGMIIRLRDLDPTPDAYGDAKEDPLELLMRLRSVTAARYAGEETIREARCRKIAVAISGTTAVFTVWADDEHVRKIRAVTPEDGGADWRHRAGDGHRDSSAVGLRRPRRSGGLAASPPARSPRAASIPAPATASSAPAARLGNSRGRSVIAGASQPGALPDLPDRRRAIPQSGRAQNVRIGTIRILIDVKHLRTHNECGYERVGGSMAYNKEPLSARPGAAVPPGRSGHCSGAPGRRAASRRETGRHAMYTDR